VKYMDAIAKNISSSVRPKTYYEELAELGMLEEYLSTSFKFSYENDADFRRKMNRILYERSPKEVPEIEKIFLEELSDCLNLFLEQMREWKKLKR
jgi:hypothetical protein